MDELLTLNEWLDALGIDRAYRKDMKETYQKDIPALQAQLAKVQKIDRPELEKALLHILHNRCVSCGAIANLPLEDEDWRASDDAKNCLTLMEGGIEQAEKDVKDRIWSMFWDACEETDEDFPIDWVDDNSGAKAYWTHTKLCLLRQSLKQQ